MKYLPLAIGVVTMILGLVMLWKYKWEIIRVRGNSMQPTLNDGDIVLIEKSPRHYILGDICVHVPPDDCSKIVIKRATKIDFIQKRVWFTGDNRDASYDSRDYGFVNIENIEGRVIKQWRKKGSN